MFRSTITKEHVILDLLRSGAERYGLEMVNDSDGKLKRGTVYVTLSRMQENKFVTSRKEDPDPKTGVARRLYRITALGERALRAREAAIAEWAGGEIA